MVTAHDHLMCSGLYLGNPSISASKVIPSPSAPTSVDDEAMVNCDLKPDVPISQPNEPADRICRILSSH
ncbi:hypothetical protein PISMIDRAFT_17063 [Pisolithus microcarpus 441]|uniref:Uncharacterized protein n=1 Tax=Pisolithus microcarpus 441 TaxID=765257 RepID=A0A0C9XR28_9AGAM|nr:hypothetical protein PISMIDRAFT_17063 [Pisolithus microcarpus 441]